MHFLLPFTFVSAALALSPQKGTPSNCKQATIPVTVTAHPRVISLSTPKNQSEVIGFFTSLTSVNSTLAADVVHEPTTLNATYNIWTLLCLPPKGKADILEFAIHGYAPSAPIFNLVHTEPSVRAESTMTTTTGTLVEKGRPITMSIRPSELGTPSSSMTG